MNVRTHFARFGLIYAGVLGLVLLITQVFLADHERAARIAREISTARPL